MTDNGSDWEALRKMGVRSRGYIYASTQESCFWFLLQNKDFSLQLLENFHSFNWCTHPSEGEDQKYKGIHTLTKAIVTRMGTEDWPKHVGSCSRNIGPLIFPDYPDFDFLTLSRGHKNNRKMFVSP